ncbi:WD repeat-containing protein 1 isoform X1 [Homo sapiens]|uniref:WD repeat domain 1 n=2 Tax=Homo sapiens TaxID=9606 RepID=A0A8V8TP22_HUMAN|nr:WD repeat-containing protein 1 isoform X1 [Homo sapiens]|eukprot:XP_016864369.1 WD repeat-containing protein 1 isoform X1 [Homo sapiens]
MPYEIKKVFASLPQVERGVSKIIGGDPKGNNFLYTNGKCVILRNIDNPALADIYTEHAHQVVVAKYAPSGFYIASGDVSGKLRIWDTTQKEHLLKYEYQPFAGKIKDIAWTEDSKRIAVVGEGREKFGAVFLWDSGSSVGEITGHNKVINSVDIKQSRPYRLATGSDDNCAAFFEGPPFKFKFTIGDHSRFVNCVRFSPDGNRFATASADGQTRRQSPVNACLLLNHTGSLVCEPRFSTATVHGETAYSRGCSHTHDPHVFISWKIYIYDGKTGEKVCALGGSKAHDGGIYAISWSPDSTHLLSASGDKTSKIWDVSVNSVVSTFPMGSTVLDQQLGCLWQKDHLLSVSLSGYINYLDRNNPSKPLHVIKGHSKSIQCLTVHKNGGKSYIYSGSHDGHINYWDSETGENDSFAGKGHTNQVSRMTVDESGQLISCSMDDTVRYTSLMLRDYSGQGVVKLDVQPKCVAVGPGGYAVVVCIGQIVLLKDQRKCFSIDNPGYEPEVVAVHPGGDTVAIGGVDGNVRLYSILGTTLKDEGKLLEAKGPVTDVAYSHDGAFLAVCDASKVVTVFSVADGYSENNVFYGHHAKIVCLAWSPDNEHFASGGMDMMVYVWTLSDPETRVKIQDAHRLHHVSSLAWLDEHTLVTTSHDASVKEWTITY